MVCCHSDGCVITSVVDRSAPIIVDHQQLPAAVASMLSFCINTFYVSTIIDAAWGHWCISRYNWVSQTILLTDHSLRLWQNNQWSSASTYWEARINFEVFFQTVDWNPLIHIFWWESIEKNICRILPCENKAYILHLLSESTALVHIIMCPEYTHALCSQRSVSEFFVHDTCVAAAVTLSHCHTVVTHHYQVWISYITSTNQSTIRYS